MSTENTSATIVVPGQSARGWASPKVRYTILGGVALLGGLVLWRVFFPAGEQKAPKSKAQMDLEKIQDESKKAGANTKLATGTGNASDQPTGDLEAIKALNQVEAQKAIDAKKKALLEDQMLANLAYQNWMRKGQGLQYDVPLATEWERRLQEAQSRNAPPPAPPGEMSPEALEELKTTHPALYAKWQSLRSTNSGKPGAPALVAQGKPGAGQAPGATANLAAAPGPNGQATKPTNIPAGIDPKTGLPVTAGVAGSGSDVTYALLEDGSPDIARGAIPVTIQYDLPGSKEKATRTIWIRPGYLDGRVRPVDPRILQEEDERYRRAMADPTDVPNESTSTVAIPYRYTNQKTRVKGADFQFQNRYVVVLPNPKGKLTPPNPPVAGEKK